MPHRTFMAFIWPSLLAMVLFIAIPIVSVAYQSLFIEHEQILITTETCGPFGCNPEVSVDAQAKSSRPRSTLRAGTTTRSSASGPKSSATAGTTRPSRAATASPTGPCVVAEHGSNRS